jgi:hypothetical protein
VEGPSVLLLLIGGFFGLISFFSVVMSALYLEKISNTLRRMEAHLKERDK